MFKNHLKNRSILFFGVALAASGCLGTNPLLAPSVAEPDTRPARNFTSFSASLECMDGLLSRSRVGQILISSTDIPDETSFVKVGADDMLVNAVSQMNRRSQKYIFIDQALIKFGGLLDIEVQNGDEVAPQLYIRGSISQLDRNVSDVQGSAELSKAPGALTGAKFGRYKKLSVVSVDMHLVSYPSRRVLAGASVANSMVVVEKGWGAGASGLINMATLGFSIQIDRVESQSQAVRNLIEVGLIELLGRHAGVPYWNCLALPVTSGSANGKDERKFVQSIGATKLQDVQQMLVTLGYLQGGMPFGPAQTSAAIGKFQADEKLLPNGIVDFDLVVLLKRRIASLAPAKATTAETIPSAPITVQPLKPTVPTKSNRKPVPTEERGLSCPTSAAGVPCDTSYINLRDFLKKQ
jgi:hypothetical protein